MSGTPHPTPAEQATAILIQATVKTGEARAIAEATRLALEGAAASLGNTAGFIATARTIGHSEGYSQGVRSGYRTGMLCGIVLGGCLAMFLRALLS